MLNTNSLKNSLQQRFEEFIRSNNLFTKNDRLLVAVSGGVDSVVLCQLLAHAGYPFTIAHCNFQLRAEESKADEDFVRHLAQVYGVPCFIKQFETTAYANREKLSIQMAARTLRYEWFGELLKTMLPPAWLLTAHHADDSIETVLINLFKETGISGLHGILPRQHQIVRPLLFARKEEITAFAQENRLPWREDASNASDKYTRNFFRLNVMPLLEKTIPNAGHNLLKSIHHLAEAELIYNEAVQAKKKALVKRVGDEWHIPVARLKLERAFQTVAFEIIKDFGFTNQQLPDFTDLLDADTGKYLISATHRIIKNRNWLIIAAKSSKEVSTVVIEKEDNKILFDKLQLSIRHTAHTTMSTRKDEAYIDAKKLQFPLLLRRWKQGDYFYPLGMQKKKKVARFLIDQKLSKTEKENVWVLLSNQHIVWVLGQRIDDRFKITETTKQVLVFNLKTEV